jgi:single-stranded DNA-binding protein
MSEITGLILVIGQTQEVGTNGFQKRLLVVETQEQYKQKIPMDFVQDKVSLLDNFVVGDTVRVGINLRGNEYNGKYYLNAQGWRIEKASGESSNSAPSAPPFEAAPPTQEEEDDLPF